MIRLTIELFIYALILFVWQPKSRIKYNYTDMYECKLKNVLYKISSYEEHMAEKSFEKDYSKAEQVKVLKEFGVSEHTPVFVVAAVCVTCSHSVATFWYTNFELKYLNKYLLVPTNEQ